MSWWLLFSSIFQWVLLFLFTEDNKKYDMFQRGDRYTLEIKNMDHLDAGVYTCKLRQERLSHYDDKRINVNVLRKCSLHVFLNILHLRTVFINYCCKCKYLLLLLHVTTLKSQLFSLSSTYLYTLLSLCDHQWLLISLDKYNFIMLDSNRYFMFISDKPLMLDAVKQEFVYSKFRTVEVYAILNET